MGYFPFMVMIRTLFLAFYGSWLMAGEFGIVSKI